MVEAGDRDEQWRHSRPEDDSEGEGSDSADRAAVRPAHDQVGKPAGQFPVPGLGPARLRVAAVGGGEVIVGGLLSPSWLVHVTRSENVVVGDRCTLETTEHHHFDRVVVSLDDMLRDPRVRDALKHLVQAGFTPDRDYVFQQALRRTLIDSGAAPEELDLPLACRPVHVTSRSGVVQVGDGSHLETETPVYVRQLVLPGAELLARDRSLREGFVAALRAPEPGVPETVRFLRDLVAAAGCGDHLRLLDYAAAHGHHDATVFGLAGFTRVRDAGAVLAGAGNTFIRGVDVEVGQFRGEDLGRAMSAVRERVQERRRRQRRTRVDRFDIPKSGEDQDKDHDDDHDQSDELLTERSKDLPDQEDGPSIDLG